MEHRNLVVLCLICFLYNVGISTTLAPIMAAFQERGCTDRDLEPSCTQPPISDKEATDEGLANAGSFFLMVGASNFATNTTHTCENGMYLWNDPCGRASRRRI